MIPVTKEEAMILRDLYPEYKVTRTMIQDSKRHQYYATEKEELMRTIASTNHYAAEIVARMDRDNELAKKRIAQQRNI